MKRLIAARELIESWRDGRLVVVGGLIVLLLLTAFMVPMPSWT